MEYQCNQRSREERRGTIGASSALNSAKNSAKFAIWEARSFCDSGLIQIRFWKPGRGQNGNLHTQTAVFSKTHHEQWEQVCQARLYFKRLSSDV